MITTISTLPEPPSRNNPATFSDKADALLGAMPTLVTELNAFVSEVNTLSFKTACKAATTTAITLSGTQTIDGQSILAGDRVLVKNQASLAQNGIYTASINAWTRAPDMDTVAEVAGSFVPITYGVANGGKIFYTTFNATGATLGTTEIPWNSLTEASVTGIGTVGAANGGTGIASYAVGDLIYASGTTTLVKLAAAASGNVLKSGTAPSWGKVALASDVSGVLPVANGGTGITSTSSAAGVGFLSTNGTGGWAETTLPGSNTTTSGIVQLASDAEAVAGAVSTKAVTPTSLRAGLNATGSAPVYACRAWVNFNGSTGAIRASGNVSSITKNGTGDYTINFTTAMQDANYAIIGTGESTTGGYSVVQKYFGTAPTTTSVRIASVTQSSGSPTASDPTFVCVSIFR
jgi:hypothetical protein